MKTMICVICKKTGLKRKDISFAFVNGEHTTVCKECFRKSMEGKEININEKDKNGIR